MKAENATEAYDKIGILLKDYPFKNGAPYFHEELRYLSRLFKHVYLFANHQPPSDSDVYFDIPKNVSAVNVSGKHQEGLSIIPLFNTGFKEAFFPPFASVTKLRALHYYAKQANQLEFAILSFLHREGIEPENLVWYSYWSDELALVLANMKSKGIINNAFSRTHNHDIYEDRHPGNYLPYRNFIFSQLDNVLCISNHGKNHLSIKYPEHKWKFRCQRLGVAIHNPLECNLNPENSIRIVSVSAILPVKQLNLLIEALRSWSGKTIEWHHIGAGKDKTYEKEILDGAEHNLSKNQFVANIFHGFVEPDKIISTLSSLNPHFLVNTSTYEGIPVSMMEACSLGIPIIGPNVCGVPELIEDRKNGYLFTPKDHGELLDILHEIEQLDETEYQKMRENALKMQRERFNAESNYIRLAEILRNV
ncbi:MAG: glycosyltransferase [Flavobacteriales bacterium]|nr:glycosyltransferase [Flavobacteriales bacterium]